MRYHNHTHKLYIYTSCTPTCTLGAVRAPLLGESGNSDIDKGAYSSRNDFKPDNCSVNHARSSHVNLDSHKIVIGPSV